MFNNTDYLIEIAIIASLVNIPVVLGAYIWVKMLKADLREKADERTFLAKSLKGAVGMLSRAASVKPPFGEACVPITEVVGVLDHIRAFGYLSEGTVYDLCRVVKNSAGALRIQGEWVNRHYFLRINDVSHEVGAYLPFGGVPASSIRNSPPPSPSSFEVHLTGVSGFSVASSEKEAKDKIEEHASTLRMKPTFPRK